LVAKQAEINIQPQRERQNGRVGEKRRERREREREREKQRIKKEVMNVADEKETINTSEQERARENY